MRRARSTAADIPLDAMYTSTHEAFVAALRRAVPQSPAWRRTRAGLCVLTLVDSRWIPSHDARPSSHDYIAVRRAVAEVRPAATRLALTRVLDHLIPGAAPHRVVLTSLSAYGERLEQTGEHRLASDVYRVIIDAARQLDDTRLQSLLPYAYLRLGTCYRQLTLKEDAMDAYETGLVAATQSGDQFNELRIRAAQATAHCREGRYPEAEQILDEVLVQAQSMDKENLIAMVAHDRGVARHGNGEFERAIEDYSLALHTYTDSTARSRLLNDIGRALLRLGFEDAAREACLVSYLTGRARGEGGRWAAAINLIAIASATRNEAMFEQYCLVVEDAPLEAQLLTDFLLEMADGCVVFGDLARAKAAYERASIVAARHKLAGDAAERAAAGLAGHRPASPLPKDMPVAAARTTELIHTIRSMRSLPRLLGATLANADVSDRAAMRTTLTRGRRPRPRPPI